MLRIVVRTLYLKNDSFNILALLLHYNYRTISFFSPEFKIKPEHLRFLLSRIFFIQQQRKQWEINIITGITVMYWNSLFIPQARYIIILGWNFKSFFFFPLSCTWCKNWCKTKLKIKLRKQMIKIVKQNITQKYCNQQTMTCTI